MTSKSPAPSLPGKSLKDLTVVELKNLCKERGIKGFVHKSKARLLEMIQAASEISGQSAADTSSQPRPSKVGPPQKPKAKAKASSSNGQQEDLAGLTIAQLKQLCKDQGIKGFTRKNKQQLLGLINSTISPEPSNNHTEVDMEKKQDFDHLDTEDFPLDESDSDQLHSEDLDANQIDEEDSADELASPELDAVKGDFEEDQFDGEPEETMVEVSDHLILELLSRFDRCLDQFDRIEALLERIAGQVAG